MTALADIGAILEVTPQDDIWIVANADSCVYVRDFSPFRIRVAGLLEDEHGFFGVYGPVTGGAERYQGLTASLLVRLDGTDWRKDSTTQANFKVGPTKVRRVAEFGFSDPRGTEIDGFPQIGRFGRVKVVNADNP